MNQNFFVGIVLFLFAYANYVSAQCPGGRYETDIFANVDIDDNVVYGTDTLSNGLPATLEIDVYTPQGDTVKNRPVVILAHGGSFIQGFKEMPDMVTFCTSLARKGFVAISLGYRLESDVLALNRAADAERVMVKAVMRAVQDGRGAVRYVRKSFVELGDPYGVDTSNIHIGGASAGGILALQVAFMDDINKLDSVWKTYVPQVGGLEGKNNPGYSSRVSSVITMAGAVADTNYITSDNLVPIFCSHSENDNTVLYGTGRPLRSAYLPILFGSASMQPRLESLCGVSWFDSHTGGSHPPYTSGTADLELTDSLICAFMYAQMPCYDGTTLQDQQADRQANCVTSIADINVVDNNLNLFPNPSTGMVNVSVDENMDNAIVEVYNTLGQLSHTERMNGNRLEMNLNDLNKGIYIIRITDKDQKQVSLSKRLMLN